MTRTKLVAALAAVLAAAAVGVVVTWPDEPDESATELRRDDGAAQERELRARVAAVVKASPTDAELAGKSDFELVEAAVRCVDLDGPTYCLHLGWSEEPPTSKELREIVAASAETEGTGDLSLRQDVRAWARLPQKERVERDRAELTDALGSLDDVRAKYPDP